MGGAGADRGRGTFGPLRDPRFRKVFAGQTVSSLGSGLVPVALAFAVLRETHSATDLGVVLGIEQLAGLALFLFGGVAADRWSRRWVMVGADASRAAGEVALGLLFVLGHPAIWAVAALAAVQGVGGGFFTPAARGLVPAVVDEGQLQQANMLQSMASNITSVVAPSVGGVLVVTVGAGWAILGDGLSFAVNVCFLLALRVQLLPAGDASRCWPTYGRGGRRSGPGPGTAMWCCRRRRSTSSPASTSPWAQCLPSATTAGPRRGPLSGPWVPSAR